MSLECQKVDFPSRYILIGNNMKRAVFSFRSGLCVIGEFNPSKKRRRNRHTTPNFVEYEKGPNDIQFHRLTYYTVKKPIKMLLLKHFALKLVRRVV